jgi:hypothetical protein
MNALVSDIRTYTGAWLTLIFVVTWPPLAYGLARFIRTTPSQVRAAYTAINVTPVVMMLANSILWLRFIEPASIPGYYPAFYGVYCNAAFLIPRFASEDRRWFWRSVASIPIFLALLISVVQWKDRRAIRVNQTCRTVRPLFDVTPGVNMASIREILGPPDETKDDRGQEAWYYPGNSSGPVVFFFDKESQTLFDANCGEW